MNVQEAITEYLNHQSTKIAPATYKAYENALRAFANNGLGTMQMIDLDTVHVGRFVGYMLTKEYSRSTANLYAVSVRGWLKWCISEGLVNWTLQQAEKSKSILADLKPKKKSRLPRLPKSEDVELVLSVASMLTEDSPQRERNEALVHVLYSTGCRVDEVVRLKVKDIDIKHREARVIGKGNKERVVFFSPSAVNSCLRYWHSRGELSQDSPAFARHDDGAGKHKPLKRITTQTARDIVEQAAKLAGVGHFTPHSFRHFYATRMLEETDNLSIVQLALGHASPETTSIYAKANPSTVRRAHQEIFGK